jgi:N-methylhydantoinase A
MKKQYRLGIDAGGTFTDFVFADNEGNVALFKATSTPEDSTVAMASGLEQIAAAQKQSVADVLAQTDLCINGTTVALNALIQFKGVKVGLICTAGHEDSLEIRLGHKEDGYRYDAKYQPARMLVPRYLRVPIRERTRSDGTEYQALHEEDVRAACTLFKREGVESVVISFVWSVLDQRHEQRAAEIVREMLPDVFLSLGCEVYPQMREYTRTSTTVLNAYLGPVLQNYVRGVDTYMRRRGLNSPIQYFQSNGGMAPGRVMGQKAVYAINSGPASAPQAGLFFAEPLGMRNIITVDMGGTSFDITLTQKGKTNISKNIDFLRYRIGVPMVQVETLGAGGGSIAWVDQSGLLRVGPQSAGAVPGPACYGRGGKEPTVTDANVILGYLHPEHLLRGRLKLDRQAAIDAVRERVAEPFGLSVEEAAYGIFRIVNNNMVGGMRRVSIERGYDPRDFVLVGAGGAGPSHITALAADIGIDTVLVPKLASGLCAFGQIISDVKYNYMAACPTRLDERTDYDNINRLYRNIEAQAIAALRRDGFDTSEILIQRSMDLRYVGQVHECTVDIGSQSVTPETIGGIRAELDRVHKQLYSYDEAGSLAEVVNLESTVFGRVAKPAAPRYPSGGIDPAHALDHERRMVFPGADGKAASMNAPVYDGMKLLAGNRVVGPAVIEEETTSIVVEPGWHAELHPSGTYILQRK